MPLCGTLLKRDYRITALDNQGKFGVLQTKVEFTGRTMGLNF